jgi:hypothetical protein
MDNGKTSQAVSEKVEKQQKLNLRVYGYDLRPGTCGPLRLTESRSTFWNITIETHMYRYVAEVRHSLHYSQPQQCNMIFTETANSLWFQTNTTKYFYFHLGDMFRPTGHLQVIFTKPRIRGM